MAFRGHMVLLLGKLEGRMHFGNGFENPLLIVEWKTISIKIRHVVV